MSAVGLNHVVLVVAPGLASIACTSVPIGQAENLSVVILKGGQVFFSFVLKETRLYDFCMNKHKRGHVPSWRGFIAESDILVRREGTTVDYSRNILGASRNVSHVPMYACARPLFFGTQPNVGHLCDVATCSPPPPLPYRIFPM